MGTIGGNVLVDTRCNYYDQTFFWRQAVGFCMKKDGDICLVAPGSAKCLADRVLGHCAGVRELGSGSNFVGSPRANGACKLEDLYRDDGIDYSAKAARRSTERIADPARMLGRRNVYLNCAAAVLRFSDPGRRGDAGYRRTRRMPRCKRCLNRRRVGAEGRHRSSRITAREKNHFGVD